MIKQKLVGYITPNGISAVYVPDCEGNHVFDEHVIYIPKPIGFLEYLFFGSSCKKVRLVDNVCKNCGLVFYNPEELS